MGPGFESPMVHHKIFFLVLRATSGTRKAVEKYAGGMFFRPWDWFAAERYRYVDFAHRSCEGDCQRPDVARWSSGQDGGLSRRKRGFDSPTGHQKSLDKTMTICYSLKAAKPCARKAQVKFYLLTFLYTRK